MAEYALEINNLQKVYDNNVVALKGIDLKVQKGDFYALLGPNGAGKSSTIGIIGSLVTKSAGKVSVFGNDIDADLITADNNYSISIAPSVGTLELRSDGSFTYIPPTQIAPPGPEIVTFEYEITDPDPSTNCSDKATVTIRINFDK